MKNNSKRARYFNAAVEERMKDEDERGKIFQFKNEANRRLISEPNGKSSAKRQSDV